MEFAHYSVLLRESIEGLNIKPDGIYFDGTVGGNICNGATSADTGSVMQALNAVLVLAGPDGTREVPVTSFYTGPGRTIRKREEVLTEIRIRPEDYQGFSGCYMKYGKRRAMEIATLGCSVNVRMSADKSVVERCRIAYGVAGPVPMRVPSAEAVANGRVPTEALLEEFSLAVLKDIKPRDSWRASKAFRQHIAVEMAKRALRESIERAGGVIE